MRATLFAGLVASLVLSVCAQDTTPTSSAADPSETEANDPNVSSSQFWHERYHGLLSMAAYGDYDTECPKTFTREALIKSFPDRANVTPWEVVERWGPTPSGLEGFSVVIPEMDKVVQVFKGLYGWEQLNNTPAALDPLYIGERCQQNCTAHAGALQAYIEARTATNDWAIIKQYVNQTGYEWSVSGHAFGGMVAQIAALDLGWRNLCHWSHSHGAPRVFSPQAASIYNSLFQGEAGQRTVANEDSVVTTIPESPDYTFTLEGFHVFGTNSTYGQNYEVCADSATDPRCIGGDSLLDSTYYYTPIGYCGHPYYLANATIQQAFLNSQSSSFYATATSTFNPSVLSTAVPTATTTSVPASAPTGGVAGEQTAGPAATTSTQPGSDASSLRSTASLLAIVGGIAMFAL